MPPRDRALLSAFKRRGTPGDESEAGATAPVPPEPVTPPAEATKADRSGPLGLPTKLVFSKGDLPGSESVQPGATLTIQVPVLVESVDPQGEIQATVQGAMISTGEGQPKVSRFDQAAEQAKQSLAAAAPVETAVPTGRGNGAKP